MNRTVSELYPRSFPAGRAFALRTARRPLAAFGAALFIMAGCSADARETGDVGDLAIAEGRALYEENCMSCHGASALGDGPAASALPVPPPGLKEHLGHHTQAQLIRLIKDGVPPAMPPSSVDEDEIQLIVDYLWTLVPESEVAALREMQRQMESMGDSAAGPMPGMHDMHDMSGMDGASGPAGMPGAADTSHTGHAPGM